jgi:hypothetical protein
MINPPLLIRRFISIAMPLFVADWVLAAMTMERVLPKWALVLANPPFGALYWWFESHWTGSQYVFYGRPVSDGVALLVMPTVVVLQAALYAALWTLASSDRIRRNTALPPDAV